ncbi:hypothetical protein R1flu_025752 [Riccia fluitans]|uniref:Uncharacterized protein n=1 Tax=Riccia fluitans TaxID=41844 RepID=A0ABD1XYM3_9MARC
MRGEVATCRFNERRVKMLKFLSLAFMLSFLSLNVEAASRQIIGIKLDQQQPYHKGQSQAPKNLPTFDSQRDEPSFDQNMDTESIYIDIEASRTSSSANMLSWCVETCYQLTTAASSWPARRRNPSAKMLSWCVENCYDLTRADSTWSSWEDRTREAPWNFHSMSGGGDPPPPDDQPPAGTQSVPPPAPVLRSYRR